MQVVQSTTKLGLNVSQLGQCTSELAGDRVFFFMVCHPCCGSHAIDAPAIQLLQRFASGIPCDCKSLPFPRHHQLCQQHSHSPFHSQVCRHDSHNHSHSYSHSHSHSHSKHHTPHTVACVKHAVLRWRHHHHRRDASLRCRLVAIAAWRNACLALPPHLLRCTSRLNRQCTHRYLDHSPCWVCFAVTPCLCCKQSPKQLARCSEPGTLAAAAQLALQQGRLSHAWSLFAAAEAQGLSETAPS